MKKRTLVTALSVSALGALIAAPMVLAQTQANANSLPIPDTATQHAYELELASFLREHPGPVQDFPKDGSAESLNAFYAAQVVWWNSVPWEAVAGQWGCSFQAFQATSNPPDEVGVISAGFGTIINCGNALSPAATAMASTPQTRSAAIVADPSLAEQHSDGR
ncbi:hypothetical protein BKA04_000336 [Cryobacterium mesophilum]|uniref:Secreted protein n=1 Tax=Terrimesophilobacter mesophilus TaxID=433647 RepID=A0A4R8V8G9_9MICO|nr:hypothetical protein [Terrimesophilobacter mesophilus]MBB5632113.1 hypothetical protein [Terrimesophilobacter mesophilus]TFB78983.1 hypothetical protein E3N84_02250 [Terrimesophilobacter mesophilus]